MATIPVSNTYARALAPSINVPVSTLSDMPAHIPGVSTSVGLLQGSIPQIVPTKGMLDFTPISIDESGWNLPSSSPSFNVGDYVKDYFKKHGDAGTNTDNGDWKLPEDMSETYRYGHYWRMVNHWLARNPDKTADQAPWVWDGSKWVMKYTTTRR
jgi:hypothetical protein